MKVSIMLDLSTKSSPDDTQERAKDPFFFLEHEIPDSIKRRVVNYIFWDTVIADPKRPAGTYAATDGTVAEMKMPLAGLCELVMTGKSPNAIKKLYIKIMDGLVKPIRPHDPEGR